MKEITVRIDGMMSIFDDAGVEKQIERQPGVARVDANFLSGTATIGYDETRVASADIEKFVAECGYHCRGEVVPAHVWYLRYAACWPRSRAVRGGWARRVVRTLALGEDAP